MTEETTTGAQQLFDLWRKQIEEGTQAWARLVSPQAAAAPPVSDPMAFFRPAMMAGVDQWARLFASTPVPPEMMQQWKQFLDQWIEAWSKALGQVMATEPWAEMMGRTLDQWLNALGPVKKAAQQNIDSVLETLNVASRTQLTNVARQIVELEERVERIEDGIAAVLGKLDAIARPASEPTGAEPR